MDTDTWVVGAEYDASIFRKLKTALQALGYQMSFESWGVGGSQEISRGHASGPAGKLTIEYETYLGLTISGPVALVAQVKDRFLRGASF